MLILHVARPEAVAEGLVRFARGEEANALAGRKCRRFPDATSDTYVSAEYRIHATVPTQRAFTIAFDRAWAPGASL